MDVNLEEKSKLNVAINFQFSIFVFWNKNWSIDCIPGDKSTKNARQIEVLLWTLW